MFWPFRRRLASKFCHAWMLSRWRSSLRIGDEDHAVRLAEHELVGRVVDDLTGNGVEMKAGAVAVEHDGFHGEEIKEERAVLGGRERDQVAARLRIEALVDVLEVGRLPAERRAAIDDLEADVALRVVDRRHDARRFS